MSEGQIVLSRLTKHYRGVRAVDELSFQVEAGRVTGFLGPNGAGKTTTLRMLLGLVQPTSGEAAIGGRRYVDLAQPIRTVGAVLDASAAHQGRTGRNHLRVYCAAAGLPYSRADEVLDQVGLTAAADRKFKGYSLGMKQRLGIATAMLGDPGVLILDEPANGLDPEGIHWLRGFLRRLAADGRTVLVSSHLLTEMQSLADDVVIVAAGKLIRQGRISELLQTVSRSRIRIRTPRLAELAAALTAVGAIVETTTAGTLLVEGIDQATVSRTALGAQLEIHDLGTDTPDLEQAFLELTSGKAAIR
ncbi:ABC transporter ATP-binding protein [Actinoplanes italicus]|uniref:ABC-2 type transport system ATP-binding protein n=2 Tax=Actinoplanes italicus TaxID=113567 RepID=A0A2T0JGL3_9ACTN|nr:ABC-2 type transport system ATP-binding protein [Actinoplanes italicus]GIE36775.1 ABC transporter ATP-binding protein [Actinoplanes italicus]